MKRSTKSLHSTRHTFINWFKQNKLNGDLKKSVENLSILKSIVGHLEKDELTLRGLADDITLDVYGDGFKQYGLLRQLDYGVDLEILKKMEW
jgi:hypothetical protein